jgi:hypothetical protein
MNELKDIITDIFDKDVMKGLKSNRLKALVTFKNEKSRAKKLNNKRKRSTS